MIEKLMIKSKGNPTAEYKFATILLKTMSFLFFHCGKFCQVWYSMFSSARVSWQLNLAHSFRLQYLKQLPHTLSITITHLL